MSHNPIILAIDEAQFARAEALLEEVHPFVGGIKLGLEFFLANGVDGVLKIAENTALPIFLDLKLHDIPTTIRRALLALKEVPIRWLTVHSSGGQAMMHAAREALENFASRPLLLGVTVLTSHDEASCAVLGWEAPSIVVPRWAGLAVRSGCDGIVCSPQEITAVRQVIGQEHLIITPGIRPGFLDHGADDQARQTTPEEALAQGADYLVIGRPITHAPSPAQSAALLWDSLRPLCEG